MTCACARVIFFVVPGVGNEIVKTGILAGNLHLCKRLNINNIRVIFTNKL